MQCKSCKFTCEKRGDWNRHIQTKKHKKKTEDLQTIIDMQKEQGRRMQRGTMISWGLEATNLKEKQSKREFGLRFLIRLYRPRGISVGAIFIQ